jgi:hypothetical protein
MDDGLVHYTRTFRKIFLIISNVFPVIKFLLYFLKKFTQHIKMSLVKRKLMALIFENKKVIHKKLSFRKIHDIKRTFNLNLNRKKMMALSNKSENEIINNSNKYNLEKKNSLGLNNVRNLTVIKNTMNQRKNSNYIHHNYTFLNNRFNSSFNNEPQNKNTNDNEISLKILRKKYDQLKQFSSPRKRRMMKKNETSKYIFPYYYYFLDICFDKIYKTKNLVCINKLYFTVYNFMGQIYDISTHILFYKQLNIINDVFKEKIIIGNELYPYYNKINIGDDKKLEKINKKYKSRKTMLHHSNSLLQFYN